jgi:NitT/TauT family transport system ATP-binding protein
VIRVRNLAVRFNGVEGLRLDTLDIAANERIGVCGPNGSGKTTLLRVLAGLLAPTRGEVAGVPPPGRTVLVHQHPYFFRGTARGNVVFALRLKRRPPAEADMWLDRLGIRRLADRTAQVLSAGERRRVAVARALAAAPEVLLLDEPFAALDDEGCASLREALEDFKGTLIIAAPHVDDAPVDRVVELGP